MYLYKFECIFLPFLFQKLFYLRKSNRLIFFFSLFKNFFIRFFFPISTFFFIFKSYFFFLFFSYWHRFVKNTSLLRSFEKWFFIVNSGLYSRYKVRFFVTGLGNRILDDTWDVDKYENAKNKRLVMKLGYSTLLFFYTLGKMKFKKHKRKSSFVVYSNNLFLLSNFIYGFRRFRSANCYTGNGIRFLKEKLKFRSRKKWGVI